MTLPRNTKLLLGGELTAEAELWAAVHRSIADVSNPNQSKPVKPMKNEPEPIREELEQPMTPALQLELAKRAVSDRMARRRE